MTEFYCIKQHKSVGYYEDGGSSYDTVLAVDSSKENLMERYNVSVDAEHATCNYESNRRYISPKFQNVDDKLEWSGSTGGGCSYVEYSVRIIPFESKLKGE